jgi:signal transduction histidine kinase/ActR/RegA family two-component response regulator
LSKAAQKFGFVSCSRVCYAALLVNRDSPQVTLVIFRLSGWTGRVQIGFGGAPQAARALPRSKEDPFVRQSKTDPLSANSQPRELETNFRLESIEPVRAISVPLFLALLIISVPTLVLWAIHAADLPKPLHNWPLHAIVLSCCAILACLTSGWLYSETKKNLHPAIMSLSVGFASMAVSYGFALVWQNEEAQFRLAFAADLWVFLFATVSVLFINSKTLRHYWRQFLGRHSRIFWIIGITAFLALCFGVMALPGPLSTASGLRKTTIIFNIIFLLVLSALVLRLYVQKRTSVILCFGLAIYLHSLHTISQMLSTSFQLQWWYGLLLDFASLFLVTYSIVEANRLQDRLKLVETLASRSQELERSNTDLRNSEDQLRQALKMEAIGRLAGGVAHDFNNLLTIIHGFSDLIMDELGTDDPRRRHAEKIANAARQASSLTYQLLAFSRKQLLAPVTLSVNSVITDLGRMLPRLIGEDIDLKILLSPETGNVRADRGQLEQVVMNLTVNARDAMPKGGTLTIETSNTLLDDSYTRQHLSIIPGPHVMITVTDTGHGIDSETQSRIFEPFFTTKKEGEGTGLGLSTVYGIVKQSGGTIWVYSEIGKGTTFKVYLPRVHDTPDEPAARDAEFYRGTETILLVEDSDDVRKFAKITLEREGYVILEAKNALEAIQISESHQQAIDLLLTDMVMPGISGRELSDELISSRRDLKILLMSGYSDKAFSGSAPLAADTDFLQKPFTRDSLLRKVRESLSKQKRMTERLDT